MLILLKYFIQNQTSGMIILDDGVAGLGGDTAGVLLVPGHLDVALLSPGGAPAVLHQPVVLVLLSAAAHHKNPVVQVDTGALVVVVNPRLVEVEGRTAGVNANRDGTDRGRSFL